jgi:hypothetical protein
MRIAAWLMAGLFLAASHAQAAAPVPALIPGKKPTPAQMVQMMKELDYWQSLEKRNKKIRERSNELSPGRRDTPLRDLNISDEEVREVQAVSKDYLPRAMVNISPVVTECPCEEGPQCTAQVYVLATENDKTVGLQLSRTKTTWAVGAVQKWWFKRDAVRRQNTGDAFVDYYFYEKAMNELYAEFPMCADTPTPVETTASTLQSDAKK